MTEPAPCPFCRNPPTICPYDDLPGFYVIGCVTEGCRIHGRPVIAEGFERTLDAWNLDVERMTAPEHNCTNCRHYDPRTLHGVCRYAGLLFEVPLSRHCGEWSDAEGPAPPNPGDWAPCPVCGSEDICFVAAHGPPLKHGDVVGMLNCRACGHAMVEEVRGRRWNALPRRGVTQ